jgi:tetratricopeptide (TPR) repeat protein
MEPDFFDLLLRQCSPMVEGGTGVFVAPGTILTCAHVVGRDRRVGDETISVVLEDLSKLSGRLLRMSPSSDLALVGIGNAQHECVALDGAGALDLHTGDELYLIGVPRWDANQRQRGGLTARFESFTEPAEPSAASDPQLARLLMFKGANVVKGFSGGPLLNLRTCRVVGVVAISRDLSNETGGWAIPIDVVLRVFPELVQLNAATTNSSRLWHAALEQRRKNIQENTPGYAILENLGLSLERFEHLVGELAVTRAALTNFLKALGKGNLVPEDLDSVLREFAAEFNRLRNELQILQSVDPGVNQLKENARLALEQGDFADAESFLNQASDLQAESARRHEATASEQRLAAAALKAHNARLQQSQLAYSSAAKYFLEAAELVPESAAEVHAEYLRRAALAFKDAGDFAEAEARANRAVEIARERLGLDHLVWATCANTLGFIYDARGKYADAERIYRETLALRTRMLGSESIDTAQSLNNLGTVCDKLNKRPEARELYRRALHIRQKIEGPESLQVARILSNMAASAFHSGRPAEAIELYQRVLAIRVKQLGKHPLVAITLSSLAVALAEVGRIDEAESLLLQTLDIRRTLQGKRHPDVATSLNGLGAIAIKRRKFSAAEKYLKEALSIRMEKLGDAHPDTARTLSNLGTLYGEQGRGRDSVSFFEKAVVSVEKCLPTNHPDLQRYRADLAQALRIKASR